MGGFAEGPPGAFVPTTWILFGKGDGTLQPAVGYPFGAARVTSGDFNGDGIADLVVVDGSRNTTGILYGKGDGTFQQARAVSVSAGFPLAVADFNGDGKADLLTATPYAEGPVTVLLGVTPAASGPPVSITAHGRDAAIGPGRYGFPNALQVTVKDSDGHPVGGRLPSRSRRPPSFRQCDLSSATAVTNASGVASVTAIANTVAGSYTVTASVGPLTALFSLTNSVGGGTLRIWRKVEPPLRAARFRDTRPRAPAAAVDGNTDGNFYRRLGDCNQPDANAWWQVDLGASARVSSVVIFNRTDCCASR